MAPLLKKLGLATLAAMMGIYVYLVATGPNGYGAWAEKRAQADVLETQNAELLRQNQVRRDRIELLERDREAQELEAIEKLNKKRPGTQTFFTTKPGS